MRRLLWATLNALLKFGKAGGEGGVRLGDLHDDRVCAAPGLSLLGELDFQGPDPVAQLLYKLSHLADAREVVSHRLQETLAPEALRTFMHSTGGDQPVSGLITISFEFVVLE